LKDFTEKLHTLVVPLVGDFIETALYSVSPLVHKDVKLVGQARGIPPRNLPVHMEENYLANQQAVFPPSYLPKYIENMLYKIRFGFLQFVMAVRSALNMFIRFERFRHLPKEHIYASFKASSEELEFFASPNSPVDGDDHGKKEDQAAEGGQLDNPAETSDHQQPAEHPSHNFIGDD